MLTVTAVERGMVLDRSLDRAARQRVVDHAAGDRAFGQPADVLPAERAADPLAGRRAEIVAGVAPDGALRGRPTPGKPLEVAPAADRRPGPTLAGEADAGEALGRR